MVAPKSASSTPTPSNSQQTQRSLVHLTERAHKAYAAGDYTSALAACESIYTADAYLTSNLLLLGAVHFQLRNLSECIFYNQQAIRVDPNFAEAYSNLGNALKELGDVEGAVEFYLKAIKIKPRCSDAYNNLASSHMQQGSIDDAISTFQMALTLDPNCVDARSNLGNLYKAQGRLEEAKKEYLTAIKIKPDFAIAWSNCAGVFNTWGDRETAIEYYRMAIKLCPDFADAHSNLGNVLKEQGQATHDKDLVAQAIESYHAAIDLRPDFAIAHGNLASCYYDQGKLDLALRTFKTAIQLEPNFPDAFNNLGNTYREMNRLEEAINSYRTALRLKPDHAHAYNNLGNAMKDKGLVKEAIHCYVTAARLMPQFAAAHSNLGSILKEQGKLDQALAHYHEAINIDPLFADAFANMGNVYKDLARLPDAIKCYSTAIKIKPSFAEAYSNLASAYKDAGQLADAMKCYQKSVELTGKEGNEEAFANLVNVLTYVCDWSTRESDMDRLAEVVGEQLKEENSLPCVQPFHVLNYGGKFTPQLKLQIATAFAERAKRNVRLLDIPRFHFRQRSRGSRIKIGYVSSDIGNHPVSHLMNGLFGLHDTHRFEVFVYALNSDDNSSWRQNITSKVEHFQDISLLQADDAATLIHGDGIHVLFNLNGFTKGAKNEIFSLKPAPIQVNMGGFSGTMGAEYIDYIVGDETVIPESHYNNYTEKVMHVPHCCVLNDVKQSAAYMLDEDECKEEKSFYTREKYGISDDVFVYACFNQLYKITPEIFDVWCDILRERDNTILWLLNFPGLGADNLLAEAEKRGVSKDRIIFSEVAQKKEHIIRCNLADLVLDTVNNGTTTSVEVLWSGTPMLSVLGENMSNRIGGSMLRSCGLEELVCTSLEEYKEKACQLADDPGKLLELRRKLEGGRESCPLFDTKKWVREFEEKVTFAVHQYEKGHKTHAV